MHAYVITWWLVACVCYCTWVQLSCAFKREHACATLVGVTQGCVPVLVFLEFNLLCSNTLRHCSVSVAHILPKTPTTTMAGTTTLCVLFRWNSGWVGFSELLDIFSLLFMVVKSRQSRLSSATERTEHFKSTFGFYRVEICRLHDNPLLII